MGRPSKSADVLKSEGKSHRTKAELAAREKAENAALTGIKIHEFPSVKNDRVAHAEFRRVKKLLAAVGKDDALYEAIINRYCELKSEVAGLGQMRCTTQEVLDNLREERGDMDAKEYYELQCNLQKQIMAIDNGIQRKRKMLMDIEKECAMTVSAALRSIPKTPQKKVSALDEALGL